MSSIYNTEPPTKGKVLLKTTLGDVDVELWPKEAPLAVRNFVQLCLEGAYDGSPFHRVIPDLMIQAGALPGGAAASAYGAPFKDEFHSRLRFTHRGLVACAGGAGGARDANGPEFFITTATAPLPHLDRVHTIFGRVAGDTIHTVTAVAGVEVGADDVPVGDAPPRILDAEVLWNPFDDVVPRSTRESRAVAAAAAAAAAEAAARAAAKAAAVRAPQLLSFGGDDDDDDDDGGGGAPSLSIKAPARGMLSAHDAAAGGRLAGADEPAAVEAAASARAREARAKRGREEEAEAVKEEATAPPPPPPAAAAGKAPPSSSPPPPSKYKRGAAALPSRAGAASDALDAWHARRAAFAARRAAGTAKREADTLTRLQGFTAALREGRKEERGEVAAGGAAADAAAPPPSLYSGEVKPDADADLPAAWRVAAYLGGGGDGGRGTAPDPSLSALAAHRLVAPRPAGAAAAIEDDGLETVDPLAAGREARGEEGGRRGGGGGQRRQGGGRR